MEEREKEESFPSLRLRAENNKIVVDQNDNTAENTLLTNRSVTAQRLCTKQTNKESK